jgi:hypothetical protein
MIQTVLFGWFLYMALLAALVAASAGWGTWIGKLAVVAALVSLFSAVQLYWPIISPRFVTLGSMEAVDLTTLLPELFILGTGLAALAAAPRQDTKLIGLLLAGSSLLPIATYFYH